jgi:hypothetical protein
MEQINEVTVNDAEMRMRALRQEVSDTCAMYYTYM